MEVTFSTGGEEVGKGKMDRQGDKSSAESKELFLMDKKK